MREFIWLKAFGDYRIPPAKSFLNPHFATIDLQEVETIFQFSCLKSLPQTLLKSNDDFKLTSVGLLEFALYCLPLNSCLCFASLFNMPSHRWDPETRIVHSFTSYLTKIYDLFGVLWFPRMRLSGTVRRSQCSRTFKHSE